MEEEEKELFFQQEEVIVQREPVEAHMGKAEKERERELCLFVFVHVRKTSVGMFILNYSMYKCLLTVCLLLSTIFYELC